MSSNLLFISKYKEKKANDYLKANAVQRGRPSISNKIIQSMCRARMLNLTNQDIACVFGVSIGTVMKYTQNIPNARRLNRPISINPRTGQRIAA